MSPSAFRQVEEAGFTLLRCAPLDHVPGVAHAFTTRLRAEGTADFGDAGPADLRIALGRALGFDPPAPLVLRQVHGADVRRAIDGDGGEAEGDAWIALRDDRPRRAVAVRTADCVPLLLAAVDGTAVAAVHAGWRGIAAGIVPRVVERLAALGAAPQRLVAAVGPSIGGCCYEVGEEVRRAVGSSVPGGTRAIDAGGGRIDLARAAALQLEGAGLPVAALHAAGTCTRCRPELFFSYRRDGRTGSLLAAIGWTSATP